jgi:hypothetical protein
MAGGTMMLLSRFFSDQNRRLHQIVTDWLICLAIFFVITAATSYRIDLAPDIFTDEIIYSRLAVRVSGENALVWDSGQPFLVHPPLYFSLQGWFTSIFGASTTPIYAAGDIFSVVIQARLWNAYLAGLTGVFLYLLGKRLHGRKMGIVMAVIYAFDPFGLRINRRAMLETLAGLFNLAGILVFLTALERFVPPDLNKQYWKKIIPQLTRFIPAGLLLGAALLSKELTFTTLVTLGLFGVWEYIRAIYVHPGKKQPILWVKSLQMLVPEIIVASLAYVSYSIYPLWVWLDGNWPAFSYEKSLGFKRLIGLVHLSGWNRPGLSIVDFLVERFQDYGSSYLLLTLGGASIVGLVVWGRTRMSGRFLIVWGAIMYTFYAFIAFAGSGNDQFFYFLLLPAIVLTVYAIMTSPQIVTELRNSRFARQKWAVFGAEWVSWGGKFGIPILLIVILPYNLFHWWVSYGSGIDNGYRQFTNFVNANLPPGEAINASGDPIKFYYFLPDYEVYAEPTPEEAIKSGIHYFALAPKDVLFRYGKIQPELSEWIQQNGQKLFSFSGSSYGDIYLYRVDYPVEQGRKSDLTAGGRHWRSFNPARSGMMDFFNITIFIWVTIWLAIASIPGLLPGKVPAENSLSTANLSANPEPLNQEAMD